MVNYKLERLQKGETFTTNERGNSMFPVIKSGQEHVICPATWEHCKVGDIVYCQIKKVFFTHFVKGKDREKGLLIGNNKGKLNGWTKQVYGKVTEIL